MHLEVQLFPIAHLLSEAFDAALFRDRAFLDIIASPRAALWAIWIPLLAGMSELAGQCVVFVSRRVKPAQAIASFALTGLIHVGAVAVWTAAAVALLHGEHMQVVSTLGILGVVSISYAPRLLSALTIAPFYGELLGRLLDAWTMACVGWGVWITTGASVIDATLCALVGWSASYLIRRFGGHVSAPLLQRLGLVTPGMADA